MPLSLFLADDTLFRDVTIFDGDEETRRYIGSVHVRGDGIHAIYQVDELPSSADLIDHGARVVDGEGGKWSICPGFIDMHAHSDLSLLHTPEHLAKITQGVTLEVLGQDGIGYAPVTEETLGHIRRQIAGWNGNPQDESFWRWKSVADYLNVLDESKIATNAAYLVPQGNLRMLVLGYDARAATPEEIEKMSAILDEALKQGAVGMSSGLTYVPGMFASDSELAHLLRIVAKRGGYYCPHTRSYGKGALKAYGEMIALAKETGVRLHLTHATLNFAENKDRAQEFLDMIDEAIRDGVDLTLDTYPYLPGSTTLASLLPSWAAEGGIDATLARLRDAKVLEQIRHDVEVVGTDGCHGCTLDWDTIEVRGTTCWEFETGKTIAALAQGKDTEPWSVFVDLLVRDNLSTTILQHVGHEENVRAIMRHSRHTGGSDGILTASKPHPRGWGTFARYLGHYARDLVHGKEHVEEGSYADVAPHTIFEGGLEEAVAHLTSRPAAIIGCGHQRGHIQVGYYADLVLFDADTIIDRATYADPKRPAGGIRSVMVNGKFAVDEGKPTGSRSGHALRAQWVGENLVAEADAPK